MMSLVPSNVPSTYSYCIIRTQGLKAVDGTIKKESDLPAADPNTPIPLKYEDRSAIGACAAEKGISVLLERGQSARFKEED